MTPAAPFAYFLSPEGQEARDLAAVVEGVLQDGLALRAWWEDSTPGAITEQVTEAILDATLVIADLRNANPNVYYEVGFAVAHGRTLILLVGEGEKPPFHVRNDRLIPINTDDDGNIVRQHELSSKIMKTVKAALRARQAAIESGSRPVNGKASAVLFQAGAPGGEVSWRELALGGMLPLVQSADLLPDLAVVHLTYGVGRVVGHGPLGDGAVSVTIDFPSGRAVLQVPEPRLYRAEVRPAG